MSLRVIISGGGTGGHIYPAISIANALKNRDKSIEILFVGAEGKMEMNKVPEAGYKIVGLPVRGLQRRLSFSTIVTVFRLVVSLYKSYMLLRKYKPNVVVGVGGYASGPLCYMASRKNISIVLQEQNSYPGVTNRILSSRASKICVAYEGMNKFFSDDKIVFTGNPVRQDILNVCDLKVEAYEYYKLDPSKKTIVIIGGSLGARTLNECVLENLDIISKLNNIQIVWQTGSFYEAEMKHRMLGKSISFLHMNVFLKRMDLIYSVADLIISRAGACTISELSLTGKATILVPSPNVAEDHQTKNALALTSKGASILVKDSEAREILVKKAIEVINDNMMLDELSANIKKMAIKDSADIIAKEIIDLNKE